MATSLRPLSPHLQVYRPQITSILSITHRATGVFLTLGVVMLVIWLGALAHSEAAFNAVQIGLASSVGRILSILWTAAFFYHLCNGIRHLVWDAGYGFELKNVTRSGIAVLVCAALLTAAVWMSSWTAGV